MKMFNQIGLEMSFKPFKELSDAYITSRLEEIFAQWLPLLKYGKEVAVLLWISDGSEILDYSGNMDQEFEWAKFIGGANRKARKSRRDSYYDPEEIHNTPRLYMEDPPVFTYGDIKRIVSMIKSVGARMTGKRILVGETFDPGPEFAFSSFKYERHPEICLATMADFSFVGCYAKLNADSTPYAGFPEGIEEGTPFGQFFGRQSQHFLSDLGFDYIWFSNGFGFGIEPWNSSGAVFNGEHFSTDRAGEISRLTLEFWNHFRDECTFPIKTRGTNMTTGIDISTDAVPLRAMYEQVEDLEAPPNSPWVSLDGDFGLELAGWMSHIARLPSAEFPFRFYTHDPWWDNSPWLDRYERYPHDIYMPMSVSRINDEGEIETPTILEFLTIDDSFGDTPDQVPNEVIPHILYARKHLPDAPGPLVWIYPFDLYHDMLSSPHVALQKIFLGDWYIRGAINRGFPLNTVMDARSFSALPHDKKEGLKQSVLLIPVLKWDDDFYAQITAFCSDGGEVLLYGSVDVCPDSFLELLGLGRTTELDGEMTYATSLAMDSYTTHAMPGKLYHSKEFSDGGVDTISLRPSEVLISVKQGDEERVYATSTTIGTGRIAWIRATNSFEKPIKTQLPVELDTTEYLRPSVLLKALLSAFEIHLSFESQELAIDEPVQVISRHANALWFAGHVPITTASLRYRMPWGVPVLTSYDVSIKNGLGSYRFDRAFMKECRLFVDGQAEGTVITTNELATINPSFKRRILVRGLEGATVRFFEEPLFEKKTLFQRDYEPTHYRRALPFDPATELKPEYEQAGDCSICVIREYTGNLLISW